MKEDAVRCPHCGCELIESEYNYDDGELYYTCNDCGFEFTENDIMRCDCCGKQVIEGEDMHIVGGDILCDECVDNVD